MNPWDCMGISQTQWCDLSVDLRVRTAAAGYLSAGYGYDVAKPRVLWDLPDAFGTVKALEGGDRVTNCSTLTTSILTTAYPKNPWTLEDYGDLQVFADRLPATDSPIRAVVRVGVGERVQRFIQNRWHLVQGVSVTPKPNDFSTFRGHAFLVRALPDGALLVCEATSRKDATGKRIGPRYRTTTLADLQQQYPADLHLAVLHGL